MLSKTMRFYGQFVNPKVDQYLYEEFFRDKLGGFFIECGAANGIADSSCKFFEEFKGWSGINVEAHPGIFQQLQENRPSSFLNINNGLTSAEDDGKLLSFNAYDFKNNSSHPIVQKFGPHAPIGFLDSAEKFRKVAPGTGLNSVGKLAVTGLSYSSLVTKYNVKNVDLFVLDVEGSELEVVKGMVGSAILPKVFCIETNNIDLDRLNQLLDQLGYDFHSTVHVNSHYVRRN